MCVNQSDCKCLTKLELKFLLEPIKYQGVCGAGWAFSAVALVESAYAVSKSTNPPDLSEQQLIDCVILENGCKNGEPWGGLNYARSSGITETKNYPFIAVKKTC